MASIRLTQAGRFEAHLWFDGRRLSKTFDSKAEALQWAGSPSDSESTAGITCKPDLSVQR